MYPPSSTSLPHRDTAPEAPALDRWRKGCFWKLLLPPYLRILEHNLTTKSTACSTWTTPVHSGTLLPPPPPVTTHYIMGDCSLLPFTQKTECFSAGNCAAAHTECRTFHSLRSLHAQVHGAHPGRQLQSPDRSAPKTLDLAFSNHQFITKSNHGISSCGAIVRNSYGVCLVTVYHCTLQYHCTR